jgi:DNA-binding PadR family transcriptional regulator
MTAAHALEGWPQRRRVGKHVLGAAMIAAMAAKGRDEGGKKDKRGGERGKGRGGHREHHRGRHGGGPGFGPWMGQFGGPPFGGGRGRRGPKARRGDVRTATLLLLAEEPRNGYQIMQEIEERSDGVWRPSPGSIYPVLQQLEDEGLVRTTETDGRKLYELTDAGRKVVSDRDEDATAPWDQMSRGMSDESMETAGIMRGVALAFTQVMHAGNEAQIAEAGKVLAETRRRLYGILAEDPPAEEGV